MPKKFWYLLACLALVVTFALPEILVYRSVDRAETPMRLYRGDVLHYLGILNAGRVSGLAENAYFAEWDHGLSNFALLQGAASFVPGPESFSIVWLALFMQIGAAILTFLALTRLLKLFDVPERAALLWSFLFTLLYGSVAFRGSAFSCWFLPFLIFGLYTALRFYLGNYTWKRNAMYLLASLLCFSLQPIYFFLGLGIVGLLWLLKLWEKPSREMRWLFGAWLLAAGVVFYALFLPFILGLPGSEDILLRLVSSHTRIPFHILYSLRLAAVVAVAAIMWKSADSVTLRKKSLGFGVVALVAFLGLNSYLVTGTYVANDHYTIVEDFAVFLMLATVWFAPAALFARRHRIMGIVLLGITALSIFDVGLYLDFSIGYSGKFVLINAAYLATALILVWPTLRALPARFKPYYFSLAAALALGTLAYANFLLYKDMQAHEADHARAQAYRPLVEALQALPDGVVLGDSDITNLASLFTSHKTYWHQSAYGERVPTEELRERFVMAKLFFSDDTWFRGEASINQVFGSTDHCTEYKRSVYLKWLSGLGLEAPYQGLCLDREARRREWEETLRKTPGAWRPTYRLDYLVLTGKDKAVPREILRRHFTEVGSVEGATIYKYEKI